MEVENIQLCSGSLGSSEVIYDVNLLRPLVMFARVIVPPASAQPHLYRSTLSIDRVIVLPL